MIRKIIHIDEEKCNGCGLCASACHEGAIDIIDGKARLVRENFCDGFGDCLPGCPTGAISFEDREALAYDEAAVKRAQALKKPEDRKREHHREGGCPGSRMMQLSREEESVQADIKTVKPISRLNQWPCQLKLLPTQATFFDGAKLLIAADCTAYAYANMHEDFMKGKITLIGCPKLDAVDYTEKLTAIIRDNDIKNNNSSHILSAHLFNVCASLPAMSLASTISAPGTKGFSFSPLLPMPLPPDVAKAATFFPLQTYPLQNVLTTLGAQPYHIGNPIRTVS